MAWLVLLAAGIVEVIWALSLERTDGFTKLGPSIWTVLVGVVSFVLLAQALKTLSVGTAYAVWTGIGVTGTALAGILLYDEPSDLGRLASLALVVVGIVGLRLFYDA